MNDEQEPADNRTPPNAASDRLSERDSRTMRQKFGQPFKYRIALQAMYWPSDGGNEEEWKAWKAFGLAPHPSHPSLKPLRFFRCRPASTTRSISQINCRIDKSVGVGLADQLSHHRDFLPLRAARYIERPKNQRLAERQRGGDVDHRLPHHWILRPYSGFFLAKACLFDPRVQAEAFSKRLRVGVDQETDILILHLRVGLS